MVEAREPKRLDNLRPAHRRDTEIDERFGDRDVDHLMRVLRSRCFELLRRAARSADGAAFCGNGGVTTRDAGLFKTDQPR